MFEVYIKKQFSPQRGYFPVKFPSWELTAPLRACGHYSSSMMNSNQIFKIFLKY